MSLSSYIDESTTDPRTSGQFSIYSKDETQTAEHKQAYRQQTLNRLQKSTDGAENKENRQLPRSTSTKFNSVLVKDSQKRLTKKAAPKRVPATVAEAGSASNGSTTHVAAAVSHTPSKAKTNRLSLASISSSLSSTSAGIKSMAHRLRSSSELDSNTHSAYKRESNHGDKLPPLPHEIPQHVQDMPDPNRTAPTLKKKTSHFRLRHSISLRRLTTIYTHDEEEDAGNMSINSSASRRLSHKLSLSELGRSFRMLTKQSPAAGHDFSKCDISLPVPQHETREKLNHKLRNSSSILSISSFISSNSVQSNTTDVADAVTMNTAVDSLGKHGAMRAEELDEINRRLLLRLCNQSRIVSFDAFYQKLALSDRQIEKLSQTPVSEVFLESVHGRPTSVYKVIPFGDIHSNQMQLIEVIQELSIMMAMSPIEGFARIKFAKVVRGPYPAALTELHLARGTEQRKPGEYSNSQLFVVVRMEYCGIDLEKFPLTSWGQAYDIINQVAHALSQGEQVHEYEHRDLHWGNVMIDQDHDKLKVKLIDFTLSRAKVGERIMFTGLDNPNFFKGKGDYQFTTYRLMRQLVQNKDGADDVKPFTQDRVTEEASLADTNNYAVFCPATNVLWIHYLLDRIVNQKQLKPVRVNPISRSARGSDAAEEKEIAHEVRCCNRLMRAYRSTDPSEARRKRKNKKNRKGKKHHIRSFEDFDSARAFEEWIAFD